MDRKKQLKREYKNRVRDAGVFHIKNLVNGKKFIGAGCDINAVMNKYKSELRFGSNRNKILQQEWNEYGEHNFEFSIVELLEKNDDPDHDYREELNVLEELWLEREIPNDSKGYNVRKPQK